MRIPNKTTVIAVLLIIIIIPAIIFSVDSAVNKKIAENAEKAKAYADISAQRIQQREAEYAAIANEIPGIVCVGADLMSSTGTINTSLVSEIENKLNENEYRISLTNLSVPGENILTVLGRTGVIPFVIADDVTIPPQADLIEINLKSSQPDGHIWPLAITGGGAGFNPVTVDGYAGQIGGETARDAETGENKHYFVRSADGEEFTISAGAVVDSSSDDEYKDYVHIFWLGENDVWTDYKDLADYIQKSIDCCGKNKDRYLVLGLIAGNAENMEYYDTVMNNYFGAHYINVRKYLSEYDLYKTTLDFNDTDIQQQKTGTVPQCFLTEGGGLNDTAYQVLADCIYDALVDNECVKKAN